MMVKYQMIKLYGLFAHFKAIIVAQIATMKMTFDVFLNILFSEKKIKLHENHIRYFDVILYCVSMLSLAYCIIFN